MRNRQVRWSRTAGTLLLLAALAAAPACKRAPQQGTGIDLTGMDKAVAPGDDFNAYANGGWIRTTPIPADKAAYGIFAILADQTRTETRALIQDAAKATSGDADTKKIGDFYSSFLDEAGIESKGIAPLKTE